MSLRTSTQRANWLRNVTLGVFLENKNKNNSEDILLLNSTLNMIKIKILMKFMIIFVSKKAEEGFSNMSIFPQSE